MNYNDWWGGFNSANAANAMSEISMQRDIDRLRNACQQALNENRSLKSELNRKKSELESKRHVISNLENKERRLRRQISKLEEKIHELEAKNRELGKKLEESDNFGRQYDLAYHDCLRVLETVKIENDLLKKKLEMLRQGSDFEEVDKLEIEDERTPWW